MKSVRTRGTNDKKRTQGTELQAAGVVQDYIEKGKEEQ